MKVTFYGTRGSIPVASSDKVTYGGNTTCLRIASQCLPKDHWLVVDAGSGIVPLGGEALKAGVKNVSVLFTHYHHDHTQGLLLCPLTFVKAVQLKLYGPVERGIDPSKMMKDMMKPPYFPLEYAEVSSHISGKGIEHPSGKVMLVHPVGGFKLITVDEYERVGQSGSHQVTMSGGKYPLDECLVVKMLKTNHPEQTISYRFEERPTGKVFVLLTDHENLDGMPKHLERHLLGADLLVMDSQYPRAKYEGGFAGFGHGTPDYCVSVAASVGAKALGLTHHDPFASDKDVAAVLDEAARANPAPDKLKVFACQDYQGVNV